MSTAPSSTRSVDPNALRARLQLMRGRDPHEEGRVASTLELLFDLTFVVAVATAGSSLAHDIAHGHAASGMGAFAFTTFGIIWAWINYAWFASAYDTDDWLYRLLTMAQMVGVVIFTLGIPDMFTALAHGTFDNRVIVYGYVIMRVAMLAQWSRAYRSDPEHRAGIRTYMITLAAAQLLWLGTSFLHDVHWPLWVCFTLTTLVTLMELIGPVLAERAPGTPWHAHHIVERHGLLTIIAIGEVVTGTVLTLQNIREADGSNIDWTSSILVAVCGVAMAFGMWWTYFLTPFAEVLHHYRLRSFGFGYSHFLIWPSIAATGGGLHIMALTFEGGAHIGHVTAALALAVPVGLYTVGLFLAHYLTTRFWARLHAAIIVLSLLVLVAAVVLAPHVALPVVLGIVTIVPWITVVAFECGAGADHEAQVLTQLNLPQG